MNHLIYHHQQNDLVCFSVVFCFFSFPLPFSLSVSWHVQNEDEQKQCTKNRDKKPNNKHKINVCVHITSRTHTAARSEQYCSQLALHSVVHTHLHTWFVCGCPCESTSGNCTIFVVSSLSLVGHRHHKRSAEQYRLSMFVCFCSAFIVSKR